MSLMLALIIGRLCFWNKCAILLIEECPQVLMGIFVYMQNQELGIKNQGKTIKLYTDLEAWRIGHKVVLQTYHHTKSFPQSESFGITNQMRRCAVSITSNIAEGFSRQSFKEKVRFYSISLGSVTELHNQFTISRDIGYLTNQVCVEVFENLLLLHKLINGLIKKSKTFY